MDTLGKRIKFLRKNENLTQDELAKAIDVSRATLASWETERREPDYETVKKLARYFNVTVDYLLGNSDYPLPPGRAAAKKIEQALQDDDELLEFWYELSQREDLQLLFKQARELKPETIKQIVGIIKMIEDKEAQEP